MNIIFTKSYDKTYKDLNKRKKEIELLEDIIKYIRDIKDFNIMLNDSIAMSYGFERLKYSLNEFYSFRLSKVIRLIVKPKDNGVELYLVYISTKHYEDFNIEKVLYYD